MCLVKLLNSIFSICKKLLFQHNSVFSLRRFFIPAVFIVCSLSAVSAADKEVLVYFYSEECNQCRYVKERVLPPLQNKYGSQIEFSFKEITGIENLRLLLAMEKNSGRTVKKRPPLIFIGNDILEGQTAILEKLEPLLEQYAAGTKRTSSFKKTAEGSSVSVIEQFKKMGIVAVIAGGLLDGINPCAFTTLIFLLSYLALVGRRGKQLIQSGLSYSLGVFTVYFLIGIGLFEIVRKLSVFTMMSAVLSYGMAAIALILGSLSIYDYFKLRAGKTKEVKLQLSSYWKKRIHSSIRTQARSTTYITASFGLGFLIGLFEFPCTGQVYFPIILVIRSISEYRMQAVLYLLLYNLLFIIPLIVVFAVVYWGISSERLAQIARKRMALIKLFMAIFFFAIALFLLASQMY
jgi:cytochrome c biogenesis protein CcdA